jgi:dihydroneopterin aldolase
MAWIALEGMRFHAFHGVHEAEQLLGGEYVVELQVKFHIAKAVEKDDVDETINYETIFQICRLEMEQPRKLLETVVAAIMARMKHQFPKMQGLRVRVLKQNPPLGGRVAASWVEDSADFISTCPRCKSKMVCYADDTCWCQELTNIHPATRETLTRQFGTTCLCANCLKLYAG